MKKILILTAAVLMVGVASIQASEMTSIPEELCTKNNPAGECTEWKWYNKIGQVIRECYASLTGPVCTVPPSIPPSIPTPIAQCIGSECLAPTLN